MSRPRFMLVIMLSAIVFDVLGDIGTFYVSQAGKTPYVVYTIGCAALLLIVINAVGRKLGLKD